MTVREGVILFPGFLDDSNVFSFLSPGYVIVVVMTPFHFPGLASSPFPCPTFPSFLSLSISLY